MLSPQARALALACLTIGALFSYDARIIGPSSIGGFAGVKWRGEDLRPYGRRRRLAFERLREMALRAAREVDATLEPSIDNAAMCCMLDIVTQIGAYSGNGFNLLDRDSDSVPPSLPQAAKRN